MMILTALLGVVLAAGLGLRGKIGLNSRCAVILLKTVSDTIICASSSNCLEAKAVRRIT
jgi:hypothetical protein